MFELSEEPDGRLFGYSLKLCKTNETNIFTTQSVVVTVTWAQDSTLKCGCPQGGQQMSEVTRNSTILSFQPPQDLFKILSFLLTPSLHRSVCETHMSTKDSFSVSCLDVLHNVKLSFYICLAIDFHCLLHFSQTQSSNANVVR